MVFFTALSFGWFCSEATLANARARETNNHRMLEFALRRWRNASEKNEGSTREVRLDILQCFVNVLYSIRSVYGLEMKAPLKYPPGRKM